MPKKYPSEYKKMIVEETGKLGSIDKVAKKYKLHFSLIYKWKKTYENEIIKKCERNNRDEIKDDKKLEGNRVEDIVCENLKLKDLILEKEIELQKLKELILGLIL